MSLLDKISYVQKSIDPKFRLILETDWNSKNSEHRHEIRKCLSTKFSSHFSREQLALLNDLNWLPKSSDAFVSISHCRVFGGFAISKFKCGFDVEEIKRISSDILKRTSDPDELRSTPKTEFLWVAKESGFKALSEAHSELVISDLICTDWQSHYENQVFSFRLKSQKTLYLSLNKGFVFSESDCLFAVYFR
jgi:phosphopantetheinyl transferase (holo-ACP synthase)